MSHYVVTGDTVGAARKLQMEIDQPFLIFFEESSPKSQKRKSLEESSNDFKATASIPKNLRVSFDFYGNKVIARLTNFSDSEWLMGLNCLEVLLALGFDQDSVSNAEIMNLTANQSLEQALKSRKLWNDYSGSWRSAGTKQNITNIDLYPMQIVTLSLNLII